MALTVDGISQARNMMRLFIGTKNHANELSNNVINYMSSNEDFNKFIEGTELGNETYEKWKALLNLIENDLYNSIDNLISTTNSYLDTQEALNNRVY